MSKSTFDVFGNVIRTTSTDGSFTLFRYNSKGQQIAESQAVAANHLVRWNEAESIFVISGWDTNGDGISEPVRPTGMRPIGDLVSTKLYSYDSIGRLLAVSLPILTNPVTGTNQRPVYHYGYDWAGNQDLIVDPLGRETRFTFSDKGQQLSRTLPLEFGVDGKRGTSDDPASPLAEFGERFVYDGLGRQTLHISFEGVVTESKYDDPTDTLVRNGLTTGRLTQQQYFASEAAYLNGLSGTPTEIRTFTYDAFGRQSEIAIDRDGNPTTSGDRRIETSTYDSDGRLAVVSNDEGVLSYEYDSRGQKVATRVYATGANLSAPNATPERITRYSYDIFGRLKSVTEDLTPQIANDPTLNTSYGYAFNGSLSRTDLPSGIIESYQYDTMGRLDILTHYAADSTPNDLSNNPRVAKFDYAVRADGTRTSLQETFWLNTDNNSSAPSVPRVTRYDWTYDEIGRLTDEAIAHFDSSIGQSEHFTYDLTGNRTRVARQSLPSNTGAIDEAITYEYDANDRLLEETLNDLTVTDVDKVTTYGYDKTQQTSKSVSVNSVTSAVQYFNYNLQGRMSAVINDTFTSGSLTSRERTSYEYDSRSYRIHLVTETGTTHSTSLTAEVWSLKSETSFLADAHNHTGYTQTIRETKVENGHTLTTDYTFGQDEILQRVHGEKADGSATDETLTFGHDGHGSVRVLTDLAGVIAQAFTFSAYGQMLAVHNGLGSLMGTNESFAKTSLGYSGELWDATSQTQYLRARSYDPRNGRFIGLDPFSGNMQDPQSLHKYAYTHGDPILHNDPTGMFEGLGGMVTSLAIGMSIGSISGAALFAAAGKNPVRGFLAGAVGGGALVYGYNTGQLPAIAGEAAFSTALAVGIEMVRDYFLLPVEQRAAGIAYAADAFEIFGWAAFTKAFMLYDGSQFDLDNGTIFQQDFYASQLSTIFGAVRNVGSLFGTAFVSFGKGAATVVGSQSSRIVREEIKQDLSAELEEIILFAASEFIDFPAFVTTGFAKLPGVRLLNPHDRAASLGYLAELAAYAATGGAFNPATDLNLQQYIRSAMDPVIDKIFTAMED